MQRKVSEYLSRSAHSPVKNSNSYEIFFPLQTLQVDGCHSRCLGGPGGCQKKTNKASCHHQRER